jgi:hypothetical protein
MFLRLLALAALCFLSTSAIAQEPPVARWDRWQGTWRATEEPPPDASLKLEFTVELTSPSNKTVPVAGFWDGDRVWKARFRPDEPGVWTYKTVARPALAGLHGQTGSFTCAVKKTTNRFLEHGPIRVAESGTYLEHADRTPFFWLGDTVWNGPMLSSPGDWSKFLDARAKQRFDVIQFNAIAPWRTAPTDADGQVAFEGRDLIRIHPRYFQRLDERMDAMNAAGLLAAPVLVWANTKSDVGNVLPESELIRLVRYQVARYGAHHVVWILAGDNRYDAKSAELWKRVGRAVFGNVSHAPVMTHPTGMNWPWESWRDERWLDILGYQSGHGDDARTLAWIHSGPVKDAWQRKPTKPIINLEPPYEGHLGYQSRKPLSDYQTRRAIYWSLLVSPPAGVTYGAHGIWSWQTVAGVPREHANTGVAPPWFVAKDFPGGTQMKHLRDLFDSLPWWTLRPAQDVLTEQPGAADPAKFIAAARSMKGDTAIVYVPVGGFVALADHKTWRSGEWFDPRTGRLTAVPVIGPDLSPPDKQDWLLRLRR